MSKPQRVYLSGGMEYAQGEGAEWRTEIEQWLGKNLQHSAFNPNIESNKFFSTKYPSVDIRKLKSQDLKFFREIITQVVEIDCKEIAERSDYVICYWDEGAAKGAGTKGELTMAKFFGKPVYLVTSFPLQELPGWVLGCMTKSFRSFDELKNFLSQP